MSIWKSICSFFKSVFTARKDLNSGGDIMRKYPCIVRAAVIYSVTSIYPYVLAKGAHAIEIMVDNMLSRILTPLPDTLEAAVKLLLEDKLESIVTEAVADLPSADVAAARIIKALLELP